MDKHDWDDAADLFEQAAALAEMQGNETHTAAAREYAVKRMHSLAMFATGKAMAARKYPDTRKPRRLCGAPGSNL